MRELKAFNYLPLTCPSLSYSLCIKELSVEKISPRIVIGLPQNAFLTSTNLRVRPSVSNNDVHFRSEEDRRVEREKKFFFYFPFIDTRQQRCI